MSKNKAYTILRNGTHDLSDLFDEATELLGKLRMTLFSLSSRQSLSYLRRAVDELNIAVQQKLEDVRLKLTTFFN